MLTLSRLLIELINFLIDVPQERDDPGLLVCATRWLNSVIFRQLIQNVGEVCQLAAGQKLD